VETRNTRYLLGEISEEYKAWIKVQKAGVAA